MQFSRALRALPVVCCVALPVAAQAHYRVTADGEWFYQEPDGKRLARLAPDAVLEGRAAQGDWLGVFVDGWIFGASVGPTPRAGFDLAVTRAPEENLRAAPGGALVARLAQGFLLTKLEDNGRWVHVRRAGWVKRAAVAPAAETAGTRTAAADTGDAGLAGPGALDTVGTAPLDPNRARSARRTVVYRAPDGPPAGSFTPATPLKVLSRSGEWARVQFEGWVKAADLETAPPGVLVGVSAAELRADPQRFVGQTLRWTLQFIALQQADELRPEVPLGATYMLARGPLPEHSFVYVVVPDAKKGPLAGLTPLAMVTVTGRVRAGRSRFLGNPVLDLVSLEVQQ